MAQIKKSGGWSSNIGGTGYKSKGGKVKILGNCDGKGIPSGGLPSSSEKRVNQVNVLGSGGDKGIPKKSSGGGQTSKWAAAHDDPDA